MALLVWLAQHNLDGGRLGERALAPSPPSALPAQVAFFSGVRQRRLVHGGVDGCRGRSVVDKAVAIVPPIAAFVALIGAQHRQHVLLPLAMLLDPGRAGGSPRR